jgi:hypothetical protein
MERQLKDSEKFLLVRMAEYLTDSRARQQLLTDIEGATVSSTSAVQGACSIIFNISGYSRPSYEGQRPFAVEALVSDRDAVQITISIYADQNGRLYELEMLRPDQRPVLEPDWGNLTLY